MNTWCQSTTGVMRTVLADFFPNHNHAGTLAYCCAVPVVAVGQRPWIITSRVRQRLII